MKNTKLHKLVQTALLAAFTCLATMVLRLPSPIGGYLNLGDVIVLLGAWLLGPVYGVLAGGLGSMLADILAGYPQYAPGTLVIKALTALIAVLVFYALRKVLVQKDFWALLLAGIVAELWMVLGYFIYEATVLQYGLGAAVGIPGNLVQAAAGVLLALPLYWRLRTLPTFSDQP